MTPGSAVKHATDCSMEPGTSKCNPGLSSPFKTPINLRTAQSDQCPAERFLYLPLYQLFTISEALKNA